MEEPREYLIKVDDIGKYFNLTQNFVFKFLLILLCFIFATVLFVYEVFYLFYFLSMKLGSVAGK